MKENKYRGRRGQTWYYGGTAQDQDGSAVIITSLRSCGDHYYYHIERVDAKTVGQYIGLHDKNNTEIYEGDIVKTKFGRICKVVWFSSDSDKCFDLRPINIFYDENKAPDRYDLWKSENIEVIGNIYDKATIAEGGIQ